MKSRAFACSGEGRGHVSRVLALSEFFIGSHQLSFWCPTTVTPLLRQKYPGGNINEVPCRELKKQNHQIHYPDTLAAQENLICSFYDGDLGPILRKELQSGISSPTSPPSCRRI